MTGKDLLLWNFGVEVLNKVATRTHTDWERFYKPVWEKYAEKLRLMEGRDRITISDLGLGRVEPVSQICPGQRPLFGEEAHD